MKEPLKRGDLAIVKWTLNGTMSPNFGITVTVGYELPESQLDGKMWEVFGDITKSNGNKVKYSTCPANWLEKIYPDETPDPTTNKTLSLENS